MNMLCNVHGRCEWSIQLVLHVAWDAAINMNLKSLIPAEALLMRPLSFALCLASVTHFYKLIMSFYLYDSCYRCLTSL